jgi:mono/diheme cytochrome c family protein
MSRKTLISLVPLVLVACASGDRYDPLQDYEVVDATTIMDAPTPSGVAAENLALVGRGEYLVELLGCGACHTDGALIGSPNLELSLAGSGIGIAYTNPLQNENPGVVYAPNLTPDRDTGLGRWSEQEIMDAVRAGEGRHGPRRILVMPWQGYAKISDEDAWAIVAYLRSIEPIENQVPNDVPVGTRARAPFVHFGVYRSRDM